MEFIKAQDLETVGHIMKALQFDVMSSATAGCVRTQKQHKLTIPEQLVNHIKEHLTDCGYKVILHKGINFDGSSYTLITLIWGKEK